MAEVGVVDFEEFFYWLAGLGDEVIFVDAFEVGMGQYFIIIVFMS